MYINVLISLIMFTFSKIILKSLLLYRLISHRSLNPKVPHIVQLGSFQNNEHAETKISECLAVAGTSYYSARWDKKVPKQKTNRSKGNTYKIRFSDRGEMVAT